MEFRSWDQLTREEQLLSEISDLHKSVYGFRYRGFSPDVTVEELEAFLADLCVEADREFEAEREREKMAIAAFEKTVTAVRMVGAVTRTVAIRWLLEAEDTEDDHGYFEYRNGLPYGYLKGSK